MLITPSRIRDDVQTVLADARSFVSAYQILEELPANLRDQLIQERGMPGQASGHHFAAASVVAQAAQMLSGIEIFYANTRHLKFGVAGQDILSGNEVCAFYRLSR